jgi:hypothetical protein
MNATNTRVVPVTAGPPTCPADNALTRAYLALHSGFTHIEAFRVPALEGLDAGLPVLESRYLAFLRSPAGQLPDQGPEPVNFEDVFRAVFAREKRRSATRAIDAASLVFAHAVFEATIHALLDIAALTRRGALLRQLAQRQVPLGSHLDGSADETLSDAIRSFISEVKRDSLSRKFALLLSLFKCRSSLETADVPLDIERLLEIDRRRQGLMHGDTFGLDLPLVESDLAYLFAAANLFVGLVATSAALEVSFALVSLEAGLNRGAA